MQMRSLVMSDHSARHVLAEILALRESGEAGVLAVLVRNDSNLSVPVSSKALWRECTIAGELLHPRLDALIVSDAREQLLARRSRLRSYAVTSEKIRRVPAQEGNLDIFYEVLNRPTRLVIVGGGHIAVPLAQMAKLLDFQVTVIDDRPEFASAVRFPTADRILIGPYRPTLATVIVDSDTCVVLVTRGHTHDQACLEEVIDSGAQYIGMIGSKMRVRTVFRHMREKGFKEDNLSRVHAPVGLDICADTPAEIAVAIVAEITNLRRGGRGVSLSDVEHARG